MYLFVDESGGHASLPAAAGAANPVHVVLNLRRHVEVDHVLNVRKIQPFRCNVGSHLFRRNE